MAEINKKEAKRIGLKLEKVNCKKKEKRKKT
jgi:hypothetical protein